MQYILLDLDGVMIPAKYWSVTARLSDGMNIFISSSVDKLNELIDQKPTKIILTTSHRNRFNIDEWREILISRDVHVTELEKLPSGDKIEVIYQWISDNEESDYLVIDDDKRLIRVVPRDKFMLTNSMIGLK